MDNVPASIEPDLASTHADVTIARDDSWLEENFDVVTSRFEEWLNALGATLR